MTNVIGKPMIGQMSGKITIGQCPEGFLKVSLNPIICENRYLSFIKQNYLVPGKFQIQVNGCVETCAHICVEICDYICVNICEYIRDDICVNI